MAIKMTMHDNDYSEIIEKFLRNFNISMRSIGKKKTIEDYDNYERLDKLLNPNVSKTWTKEDKIFLKKIIKKKFLEYFQSNNYSKLDYVDRNLEISFVDSVPDKWRNGEDVYWFFFSGGNVITL